MTNGRKNLSRGSGAAVGSGGKRRYSPYHPNRSSRRQSDASELCSPHPMNRPPVQRNQPPPPPPPTHARRSRRRRAGGAWSTSVAPPPPPQLGNRGSIQVRGGCGRAFRTFCFSISFDLWARLFVSFSYSLGN